MKIVNWGIIGCGNVCEKKAGPALYGVENSNLVAVMRRTKHLAEDFAKRHNVPRAYGSVEELLADPQVDTVYVATPDAAHEEGTLAALNAGKDVLVEKAMATDRHACQRMIDLAKEKGRILAVAYYRRGYPTILRAKQLIDQGAIGAVEQIIINDEFPLSHRLDLCHFFCGEVKTIRAQTQRLDACSCDIEGPVLYCKMENGAACITNQGWDENLVPEQLDIRGEKGRICILDLKAGLLVIKKPGEKKVTENLGPLPATHWGLVDNYVKYVNNAAELACDGVEGRKSTVILDIVEELQPDGKEVAVAYE